MISNCGAFFTKCVSRMVVLGHKSTRPVSKLIDVQNNKHHVAIHGICCFGQLLEKKTTTKQTNKELTFN